MGEEKSVLLTQEASTRWKDELAHRHVPVPRGNHQAHRGSPRRGRFVGERRLPGRARGAGEERGRINELTVKLRNATIVEAPKAGKVGNGSLVTLELAGREMTYALGSRDIKVATKYDVISPESPIGAAILGANEEIR